MNIILLGKGRSINKLTKKMILEYDIIAWANLHDHVKQQNLIPNKLDYLFIREKSFINDLTNEQQDAINKLDIKHVISTREKMNKVLKYDVEKQLNHLNPYGFNAATGTIAFNYLVSLKPNTLTICGLDLFMKGEDLYYFSDLKNSLSSTQNNINLNKITKEGKLLKNQLHEYKKTIDFMRKVIIKNKEISFIIYTVNDEFKNNLEDLENVEMR